jgi:hypothetical protein
MVFWMTLAFLFSQIFAGIAIIWDIFSFQFKKREAIITCFLISATCIALHYAFLDRYSAAVIIGIGIIRFFISLFSTNKYWIPIFILLYSIATYILFKDWYDLLILTSLSLSTIASFQKNDKILRYFMFWGTLITIIYNFVIFSPVWVLLESIFLVSNIVWYYRHYIKKRIENTIS